MKRLIIWLALLLPFIANAQVNGTIQKTASSGVVRGNFGSSGADTIVTVRGVSVNGQLLQYNSTYKKWIPYTPSAIGSTGIISGGTMTGIGSANLIVSSGTGTVLDNTTPASPSFYNVSWSTDTIGLTDNSTNYIYVTSGGVIMATTATPTPQDYRTQIYLGRAQKISGAITSINGDYVPVQQIPANIDDMFKAYGLAKTGLAVSASGANLKIAVGSGDIYGFGINFSNDVLKPNNIDYTANNPQTFRMVTSGDISTTNVTDLPVGFYNPSGTTVSAIGGGANESSIFTVYKFPTTGNVRILYGNTTYSSLSAAVTAIGTYVPTPPAVFRDAIIIGYIAAVKNATNLSNTAQAVFVTTNKFGLAGMALASSALTNYVPNSRLINSGYGLTGGGDLSNDRTLVADTTSADGLVSKSRLATNLGGYVPTSRTLTINGTVQDLSANRTYSVGTVTSIGVTPGTGISVSGSPITSSGNITVTNTAPDQTVTLTGGTGISASGTYPNFTITNTSPSPSGLQDSLTKKANKTFDNVAAGAIANAKLANSIIGFSYNTSSLSPQWSGTTSLGNTATLSIPMAQTVNVTAGLLSKADYDIFNAKQAALSGTGIVKSTSGTISYLTDPLPVGNGGTGRSSVTTNYIPFGAGTSALQESANLTFNGTSIVSPSFSTVTLPATSGTLRIGTQEEIRARNVANSANINVIGTDASDNVTINRSGTANTVIGGVATSVTGLAGFGDVIVYANNAGVLGNMAVGSGLSFSGGILSATGGSSGSVTTSGGTAGKIAKFTSASNIENSIMTESASLISVAGVVEGTSLTSTVATGTPPFSVTSTTPVTNLSIGGNSATTTALATARNIQGVSFNGTADINPINGTGFVKATGTTLSYDNSTYLTTSSASSTYAPINSPTFTGAPSLPTGTIAVTQTQGDNSTKIATTAYADGIGSTVLAAQKQIANIYTNTSTTGTTTQTLFTSNIAQSNLSADGDRIDFNFAGSFGLNANDKFVYLLIGGNTIAVSGNASSKSFWECEGYLLRTSSTTFRLFIRKAVDYVYSSAIADYTVTDFNPLTFSVLGQTNNASFPVTVQMGYLQGRKAP